MACARLGLRAKYIGTVGDDERGRVQMESLQTPGINLDHVQCARTAPTSLRTSLSIRATGERTVLWSPAGLPAPGARRDHPREITCARLLHIDGHDTPAVVVPPRLRASMASR